MQVCWCHTEVSTVSNMKGLSILSVAFQIRADETSSYIRFSATMHPCIRSDVALYFYVLQSQVIFGRKNQDDLIFRLGVMVSEFCSWIVWHTLACWWEGCETDAHMDLFMHSQQEHRWDGRYWNPDWKYNLRDCFIANHLSLKCLSNSCKHFCKIMGELDFMLCFISVNWPSKKLKCDVV